MPAVTRPDGHAVKRFFMGALMLAMLDRRQFLAASAFGFGAFGAMGSDAPKRPRVAVLTTVLRFRSHAFNILENFFRPFLFNGQLVDPGVEVVSLYVDQIPEDGDLSRDFSQRFNVPVCSNISDALTLGTGRLAVDAVLSIVEQGEYPKNERGVVMYPRKQFFDQAACVMRQSGRFVPFFNDKHFSYRWDWSREMYDVARCNGMPLMAGSSVPLAQRSPMLTLPENAEIEEAVAVHGGGFESYDFHALEVLQSFVEARRGGETGIESVEFFEGDALQQALAAGRWSKELATAAMQAEIERGNQPRGLSKVEKVIPADTAPSHAVVLSYRDGLKASVLKIGSSANRWNFSCRLKGDARVHATSIYNGPWGNRNLFKALSHSIQHFFRNGKSPYPVERTLLVSGVLDAAMWSKELCGCRIDTPNLAQSYAPRDFSAFRETGASWRVLTSETPEKKTFEPGDADLMR